MVYRPNRTFYLFDGRLRCIFAGRPESHNLRQGACQGAFDRVTDLGWKLGVKRLFAPIPAFTNEFAHIDDHNHRPVYMRRGVDLIRPKDPADAGMVSDGSTGLLISNADCHLGIVLDPNSHWWSLVHLGLECLLAPESVLERVVKNAPAKPNNLLFVAGFGIGPCCNGYHEDHGNVLKAMQRYETIIQGRVKHGPRAGQVAFNNLNAIKEHAFDLGFNPENVRLIEACTACHGALNGSGGVFHSNVYDQGGSLGGRNCFMAVRVK